MLRVMKSLLLILSLCSELCFTAFGQTDSIIVPAPGQYDAYSFLSLGMGRGRLRDTYLTNLQYQGSALDVQYDRRRLLESFWISYQRLDLSLMQGDDCAAGVSSTLAGRLRYRYAREKCCFRHLSVGPYVGFDAGFNYNLKLANANNPATARLAGNVGVSARAGWSYRIAHERCGVHLSLQAPLLGCAFVPEYGASYYETFYLDHTDHDAHFTSLHNQQDLDARLLTDLPVALVPWFKHYNTRLRLGLAYHIETMDINHIITRYSTFQFVVGWSWQYSPRNRRP